MQRAIGYSFLGWLIGSVVLGCFFLVSVPRPGHESGIWITFSIMGGVPIGISFALFSMLATLQEELRETRREMKAWMMSFQMIEEKDPPSVGFKPGPPKP